MAEDGESASCTNFLELCSSELGDGISNVSEGLVSLELGSKDGEIGKGLEADVLLDIGLVADVLNIDFIADVRKEC